jgi:hypothetical protein
LRRLLPLLLLVAVAAVGTALFALRYQPQPVKAAIAIPDATCLSCHRGKATYENTAHRTTSRHPTRDAIAGRFETGANVLRTSNPYLYYRMDSAAGGFTQTAVFGQPPDTTTRTERFEYVLGS